MSNTPSVDQRQAAFRELGQQLGLIAPTQEPAPPAATDAGTTADQPGQDVSPPSPIIQGPIIPGQEQAPAHRNRTTTSAFLNQLFNP